MSGPNRLPDVPFRRQAVAARAAAMRHGRPLLISAVGFLIGLLTAVFAMGGFHPVGSIPGVVLERLPTPMLAHLLAPRRASRIVADSRASMWGDAGVWLYEQPTAYGGYFCRFVAHYVPYGGADSPEPKLEEAYGLAGDPAELAAMDQAARVAHTETACRTFRDFEHPLPAPHEAAALMTAALRVGAHRTGGYRDACIDHRDLRRAKPCDAAELLRTLKPRELAGVERLMESFEPSVDRWTLRLMFARPGPHGHPVFAYVTIPGRGELSSEGTFRDPDWSMDSVSVELGGG